MLGTRSGRVVDADALAGGQRRSPSVAREIASLLLAGMRELAGGPISASDALAQDELER
jgi:hypothetical protein